ncbi:MAG: hypothetical protein R3F61_18240 [Myxococcota bacterium]
MRTLLLLGIASTLALGTACSENGLADAPRSPDTADTDEPVDTDDTGVLPGLEGDWMALSGTVDLADGQPVDGSVPTLQVLLSDSLGVLTEVPCGATLVGPAEPVVQVDDPIALYGNWRFTVDPGTCAGLPATLELGIGPLDTALWPYADQEGASRKHTRGLYTPNAGRTGLWVFGLAGTTAQIAGEGTPASLDPLPDGRYHLRSAYLLAL